MNLVQQKIQAVEDLLLAQPQLEIAVETVSGGGMHARTIRLKAGTVLTGQIHLTSHLNITHGDITIVGEAGARRYTGSHVIASQPGAKRIGFVHADTVWTTILKTDETDAETVKQSLAAQHYDDPRLATAATPDLLGN